ncbi:MAG: cobyrinate a,c-diamide synthase [Stappiaceae bacterium]
MSKSAPRALMIAAPGSGAGKTTITLAIIRALRNAGVSVISAKSGPDYIDPQFHSEASGKACVNLDAWAMPSEQIQGLATHQPHDADIMLVEAAMGLFDGAADNTGSAADLSSILSIPIILVIDCAKQAQSVAALVSGFAHFRPDIRIAGLILNKVGSARHGTMLQDALKSLDIPIIGIVHRHQDLNLPERHLGLVQAQEHNALDSFLNKAAALVGHALDLELLQDIAAPHVRARLKNDLPPLGQHMAIARDDAFSFIYPHQLDGWHRNGSTLSFFSPLNNEGPDRDCDAIFLPGGYPELHAGELSEADTFRAAIGNAAEKRTLIYGECGGYMALGQTLTDAEHRTHRMLGLLPLSTSFATRKLSLGYRRLTPLSGLPWQGMMTGHEFHYATIATEESRSRLFSAEDASGQKLADMGHQRDNIMGSFAHIIACDI